MATSSTTYVPLEGEPGTQAEEGRVRSGASSSTLVSQKPGFSRRQRQLAFRGAAVAGVLGLLVAVIVLATSSGSNSGAGGGSAGSSGSGAGSGGAVDDVDCVVSAWSDPGPCSKSCGSGGFATAVREVKVNATGKGAACPPLRKQVPCYHGRCPFDASHVPGSDMPFVGRPFDSTRGDWSSQSPVTARGAASASIFKLYRANDNETAPLAPDGTELPHGAVVRTARSFDGETSTSLDSSYSEFSKTSAKSWGLSVGLGFLSASTKVSNTRKSTYNSAARRAVATTSIQGRTAVVDLSAAELDDTFVADLEAAANDQDTSTAWKDFFLKWGTHYADEVAYGGKITSRASVDQWSLETGLLTERDVSVGAAVKWKVSIGATVSRSEQAAYNAFEQHSRSISEMHVTGGDTFQEVKGDLVAWIRSLDTNPVPVGQVMKTFDRLPFVGSRQHLAEAVQAGLREFQSTCPTGLSDQSGSLETCSANGWCDYETGLCRCDPHFGGSACDTLEQRPLVMSIGMGRFHFDFGNHDKMYWKVFGQHDKQMCSDGKGVQCLNECPFGTLITRVGILPCHKDFTCSDYRPGSTFPIGTYTIRDAPVPTLTLMEQDTGNDCLGGYPKQHDPDDQILEAFRIGEKVGPAGRVLPEGFSGLASMFGTPHSTSVTLDLSGVQCHRGHDCQSGSACGFEGRPCTLDVTFTF